MSVEAAVTQYRQSVVDAFAEGTSFTRAMCTKEVMRNGLNCTFLVSGSSTDAAVTRGVNGEIPYNNPTNTQVTATLAEYHAPYKLTGFNVFASQGDQKAVMRKESVKTINRKIDTLVLAELANATIDTGTSAPVSNAMIQNAIAALGNNAVPVEEEDNMFCIGSPSMRSYLMQMPEYTNSDYVDVKAYNGAIVKMRRWAGINWAFTSLISGNATSTELCYLFHRSALGLAVGLDEGSVQIGYDAEQDYSWSRASVYIAPKILQNSGIVQIKHNGAASALS